ncbi:MAG: DUF1874 domain-containing protein [Candidatus Gracilibacteria bacterium]|nr:DUF1874 domain-containing protein [Candidatus Gracilibacteria bacterium]
MSAKVEFSKISVKRIRERITDSEVKKAARGLVKNTGLYAYYDEGNAYIYNQNGSTRWYDDYTEIQKIESLGNLGLPKNKETLEVVRCAIYGDSEVLQLESVIGHADTAKVISNILDMNLPVNRANVKLEPGEKMIIAQYSGPRLPEGAITLPEGAKMDFIIVEVQ